MDSAGRMPNQWVKRPYRSSLKLLTGGKVLCLTC